MGVYHLQPQPPSLVPVWGPGECQVNGLWACHCLWLGWRAEWVSLWLGLRRWRWGVDCPTPTTIKAANVSCQNVGRIVIIGGTLSRALFICHHSFSEVLYHFELKYSRPRPFSGSQFTVMIRIRESISLSPLQIGPGKWEYLKERLY